MIDKLIPGKCYKVFNKHRSKGYWNLASIEYIKGNSHSAFIKCYYGDTIIFLEKVTINDCTYANEFLKCLIRGKLIAYFGHWENQLIFEEL